VNGLWKLRRQQLVVLNKLGCNIHTQIIAVGFIIVKVMKETSGPT
jgi:hypothetical protein